jgi:hypothetical protein
MSALPGSRVPSLADSVVLAVPGAGHAPTGFTARAARGGNTPWG